MPPQKADINPEAAFSVLLDRFAEEGQKFGDVLALADDLRNTGADGITLPFGDERNPDTIVQITKETVDFVTRGIGPVALSTEVARRLAAEAEKKPDTQS